MASRPPARSGDEDVAARLREAVKGSRQLDIAILANISTKTLQSYLSGGNMKLAHLSAIADALEVSVGWLVTGRGPKKVNHTADPPEAAEQHAIAIRDDVSKNSEHSQRMVYIPIPRFNIRASAGFGALVEHEQVVEYVAYNQDFVRTHLRRDPKHLVLVEARGDSMEPSIRDGDILTVDISPDQAVQHSQVHVIRVDDDLIVKRLERRLDGGLTVHSDNPRYSPEFVARDQLETLHILGRVLLVTTPPR